MSFSLGQAYRLTVYGQSHANAIGVVIDGLPAGIPFPHSSIQQALSRRRPGQAAWTTSRREADLFTVKSGIVNDRTCGAPVCLEIVNQDVRSQDYDQHLNLPRPSHADYPAQVKYQHYFDHRGGGHFSGRMTAPLVMAGALAQSLLAKLNVQVYGHIVSIANLKDQAVDPVNPDINHLSQVKSKTFPVLDDVKGQAMQDLILEAKADQDSVGGQVEIIVTGLPVGLGRPLYDSCESKLAHAMFGIPAIRGIEFGTGFPAAMMRGSQHNDDYRLGDHGQIKTVTNHHGGIIGGLTTGMPLIFRLAVKPTSSIGKSQQTVDLQNKKEQSLLIQGRHDPCIVPRVLPVVEAMTAVCLLDLLMLENALNLDILREGSAHD